MEAEMIDLCDSMSSSSDDDEEESGCHNLSRRGALLLPCQQQRNSRKRGLVENNSNSLDALSVSSSPSLSPGKHIIMGKSNREKKQEQLDRAKRWSDDHKKKRAPSNNNAGVVNLSSPSPAARGSSVAAAAAGPESPTNSPHRKMSSREKQDARDRAKIWSDECKKAANNNSSPHRVTLLDSDSDDDSDGEDMLAQFREMRARQERNARRDRQICERDSRVMRTDSNDDDPLLAHQLQSSARTHGRRGRRNRGLDSSNAGSIIRTDSNNDPLDAQLRGRRIRRTKSNSESQQHHQSQSSGFATFDAPGDTQRQSRGRRMRQRGTNIRMSSFSSDDEPQTNSTHVASSAAARGRTSTTGRSRGSQRGGHQQQSQQWQCPRCTLLNSNHASRCGACAHNNPSQPQNNNDSMSSTEGIRRMMSGNGYPSANPYSSAGLSDMLVDFSRRNYSSEMSEIARAYRIAAGGGGGRRSGYNPFHHALHSTFGAPRDSIDNMSYEQLLERFGDGSENRGASSSTIASLPVNVVGNPESELPEDKRQCSICLEDFSRGEERTTLLCLHGFHTSCINRWLQSNGTCPVCKTSVNSN